MACFHPATDAPPTSDCEKVKSRFVRRFHNKVMTALQPKSGATTPILGESNVSNFVNLGGVKLASSSELTTPLGPRDAASLGERNISKESCSLRSASRDSAVLTGQVAGQDQCRRAWKEGRESRRWSMLSGDRELLDKPMLTGVLAAPRTAERTVKLVDSAMSLGDEGRTMEAWWKRPKSADSAGSTDASSEDGRGRRRGARQAERAIPPRRHRVQPKQSPTLPNDLSDAWWTTSRLSKRSSDISSMAASNGSSNPKEASGMSTPPTPASFNRRASTLASSISGDLHIPVTEPVQIPEAMMKRFRSEMALLR